MTANTAIIVLAALALGAGLGWLAAMRWGQPPHPPHPPSSLVPVELADLDRLFSRFVDNTTHVVGGLQEDVNGLKEAVEKVSRWAPGQEVSNPAQLLRWMAESSEDRRRIRHEQRVGFAISIALFALTLGLLVAHSLAMMARIP